MTLTELRAACERAGMYVYSHHDGSWSINGPQL